MIDLYTNSSAFVFKNGNEIVGQAKFNTLKLMTIPEVRDSDSREMYCLLSEFVAGECFKLPNNQVVVLGEHREFTHEVTLRACGNPDHGQYADIAPKKTVMVCDLAEASEVVSHYQQHYNMGMGNCAKEHGVVYECGKNGKRRKKVGRISYNGSFMTVAQIKAEDAKWAEILASKK